MGENIKRIATYYTRLCKTNNPFIIADYLDIQVYQLPLGRLSGYYKYLKRHKCIYINSDIEDDAYKNTVMAHELGHAILEPKENCYFLNKHTLILTSRMERRANVFAAELLISDELLAEQHEYSVEQLSRMLGYHEKLILLKMEGIAGA